MSFSFLVFYICFLLIRMFLLILFIAYSWPENLLTTRKTLPKEPLSMTLITLKSLSLLLGSPSLDIRHYE